MITQLKDYKIIKLIGKGSFGEVYKVSKDNKFYALKMYKISNEIINPNADQDSLMIESITKQNAVANDNKTYSDKMFDDTIVGFIAYPRNYFNSGTTYKNHKVKMYYDLYSATYNETKRKYECIIDNSKLVKRYEYSLVDNPKDAKQKM